MSPREVLRTCLQPQERSQALFDKLMDFSALLLRHNKATNLIGPMDEKLIIRDLLVDSILPALSTDTTISETCSNNRRGASFRTRINSASSEAIFAFSSSTKAV